MSTTKHEREELDALAAAGIGLSRALVDAKIIINRRDRLEAAEMLALALVEDIRRFRRDYGFAESRRLA
jgi:hypothetical protein